MRLMGARLEDRLKKLLDEATVTESGCMEPTIGCTGRSGRATLNVNGKSIHVTRLLIPFLMQNPVDITGLDVRHTCDNRKCINPEHLLLGTRSDNEQDKLSRPSGNRSIKLNWNDVRLIRELYATDLYSQQCIADMFEINFRRVSYIVNNKQWKETAK